MVRGNYDLKIGYLQTQLTICSYQPFSKIIAACRVIYLKVEITSGNLIPDQQRIDFSAYF